MNSWLAVMSVSLLPRSVMVVALRLTLALVFKAPSVKVVVAA